MREQTPINKGNYSMEPLEREEQFEKYRAEGWEDEYFKYRKRWNENAKKHIVEEWPTHVDIELSTICNLKCPMCYTITDEFKKCVGTQFMDKDLFEKIVDEIEGHVPSVRLSLRGEATLHPNFIEMIRYAKSHGIGEVSFLTNGSKLSDEFIREIIDAGADWITVSIDGINKDYDEIRKPLKFEETFQKIKRFYEIKKELGRHKPVIKIQGIWPAIKKNLETYYNMFEPITDLIAFNPLIDYLDNDSDIIYEEDFVCPQLYQRIVVASNGQVFMCSNDEESMNPIGNMKSQTIYDIWHGERLNEIRKKHENGDFKSIPLCRKCYLPRATEDNECAILNGRKIVIKNYIGRNQAIGK